ncbi:mechanosensitive ion channel protein [Halobacteriales archaeon QS_6_64_34]|nr:MAG: mechanosensitive ion channel protein [Halobacteriales archaeon QS_6_64_34]
MQVPAISALIQEFLPLGPGIAGTIASLLVFAGAFVAVYFVGKLVVTPLVDRSLSSRDLDAHARKPIQKVVSILMLFVAVAVAFGMAGFENFLTAIATIGAAATLGIAFAMQDVLKNFIAGVFIFTDKSFRIGDWIEWDTNAGVVEDISLRVTRVRTFDNELLTVPNSNLTEDVIKNPVAKDRLRLKFLFGIGYDDDIDRATEIIIDEAEAHEDILADPAPSVCLTELGDSSVGLQSRIWIDDPSRADWVKTRGEYVKAVKQRFDEEDITIPYPNRTIGGGLEMAGLDSPITAQD